MRALAVVWVLLLASPARANDPFRYDWSIDSAVTVIGIWGLLSSENAKKELTASGCHWCERDGAGNPTLNAFDAAARDHLRLSDGHTVENAGNALGYAIIPLVTLGGGLLAAGVDHRLKEYPVDLLLFAESAIIAADLNQAVKFAAARERPFVHFTDSDEARLSIARSDSLTSFFSGHTTLGFAMATAAGTIASMRHYRLAPLVWVLGVTLATTTGYLRVAADRHYMSDVLVGGFAGSLIGFVNPYFVHRKRWRPVVKSVADGALLGVSGSF
jgi:membrane-associated phospholipid phosphatase